MSSTRNKNTPGDYCLQQRAYTDVNRYTHYEYSQFGHAYHPAYPSIGYTPSHMPMNTLSNNPIEIESALWGINSSNLVNPQAPPAPQLKTIPSVAFFEMLPTYVPEPLVMENNQRPFPIP